MATVPTNPVKLEGDSSQGNITNSANQFKTNLQQQATGTFNNAIQAVTNTARTVTNNVTNTITNAQEKVANTVTNAQENVAKTISPYAAKPVGYDKPYYDVDQGALSEINLDDLVREYENVLLKYHNYTWNFSLYALNKSEYSLFLENPSEEVSKHIIAQSGVTGRYSISSVKINNVTPATPGLTTNYSINDATIEITEQNGMSLYHDLVMLSNNLEYNKLADVPLVLELDFVGFDQDSGIPTFIPGTNKKWGVRINNISASASEAGGTMTYVISVVSTRSILDNSTWTMTEPFTCVVSTFGDFVTTIKKQLNDMAVKQYGYLTNHFSEFAGNSFYDVIVSEDLINMPIISDPKQSPETTNNNAGGNGSKQFSWNAKAPISRTFDDVIDCCTPINELNNVSNRQFINIIPIAKYVGFDPVRNVSAYKNVFYILKYKIGDVTSTSDLEDNKFNLDYFIEHADKITDPETNQFKLNIKKYDYQFTGLNSEIINLDLKFDQQFHIAVMRNPNSQVDTANSAGTHNAELLELGDIQYNTSLEVDRTAMWSKRVELETRKNNGEQLTDSELQFMRDSQNVIDSKFPKTEGDDAQNNLSLNAAPSQFVEDYREQFDLTTLAVNGIGGNAIKSIPVDVENIVTTNSGTLGDNSSDDELNRRLTRDNYYNRSFLMKLDMKVVGDPYWLGWGDYSYLQYLNKAVQNVDLEITPDDLNYANYLTSEAYLLLNLRPVVAISNETGILDYTQPSIFAQTLYRVNRVVSEFNSNGQFTQQLMGAIVIRSLRKTIPENNGEENNG